MELRSEIRRRLGTSTDWARVIEELEKECETLTSEELKSERLYQIGQLAEEVIPDRDRALAIYQRAWKTFPQNVKALSRARHVYKDMGRLEMVAKVGELELKGIVNDDLKRGELAMLVGETFLDLGNLERAEVNLSVALACLPDSVRVRDALAAVRYDKDEWVAEVERITAEAEKAEKVDTATAARLYLRAARILLKEMPDDRAYEDMLRKVLKFDPQSENASFLLESLLAKANRWDELSEHQERRAYAVADESERAALYRKFALEWIQRFKDRERAAGFFKKALEAAYENGADKLPSQVAGLSLLREILGARKEWPTLLSISDQALNAHLNDDTKLYAATLAGVVAWKEMGDIERARPYFERIRAMHPEASVLAEFDAEAGTRAAGSPQVVPVAPMAAGTEVPVPTPTKGKKGKARREAAEAAQVAAAAAQTVVSSTPEPVPPAVIAAPMPVATTTTDRMERPAIAAVVSAPPVAMDLPPENLAEAQQVAMASARNLEQNGATPDKVIDAWKKAIAADPSKRGPRRELARVLRRAERWNALVEALKDEEAKACREPDDKVSVLVEMVEVYRDRLHLDVMVASTLNQILTHQPGNVPVLDQLAHQYETMKRWPDLVATLKKKVPYLTDTAEKVALHLRIANLYIEKFSNQAEAIKSFEATLELDPDNVEAAGHLKQVYEKRRDWEKLIALEKREIVRAATGADRLRRLVDLAKLASDKLKKPAVSIEAWAEVLALDPDHLEALAELEKLYEREKQWEKLAEVTERQADLAPDPARKVAALQKLGILFTEKISDNNRAIATWQKLLMVEPENRRAQDALKKLYVTAKAWGDLETFYAKQGKLDEFARVMERQVEVEDDATKVSLSNRIAILYRDQLGKPQNAMRWFEKVLATDARNLAAAEALIPLYEQAKDPKKLAGVLEIQLERTEDPAERTERTRRLAALCEQAIKDKGASYSWWLQAFEAEPGDESIRAEVERLARETGGFVELVDAYEAAVARLPSPEAALPLLSVVAKVLENDLGETDRALETNQQILDVAPDDQAALDALERLYLAKERHEDLLHVLGRKLELTGDPLAKKQLQYKVAQIYEEELQDDKKAITAYRAILDAEPDSSGERNALAGLERIYERRKAWDDLSDVVVRQLAIVGPDQKEAHAKLKYRLGQIRETQAGDVKGAIEAYRDILELVPNHEGARASLEQRLGEETWQLQAAAILEPIYERLGSWRDLVKVHEIQLEREKDAAKRFDLLLRIGELQGQRLGDAEQSFRAYARAFGEDPARPEAREHLERLGALLDDGWPRLVELYEAALAKGGLDPALQHELSMKAATAYDDRMESSARSVEHYRRALQIEPEDTVALEALDRIFTREERYAELLEVYKKKVELARDPETRLSLLTRIASIWEEMLGNPVEAIATYNEILGQDHENLRALRALDRLYQTQEQWQDLADNLVRQLALAGDATDAAERRERVTLLGRLAELRELQLGEMAAAVDTYRQVLELDATNEAAVRALERLIDLPEHEMAIATVLEPVYQQTGDWKKQVGVYEIMVRHALDPARKIELLHKVGELYELGEVVDQAFGTYARALREDPSGADTQKRLERLARVHDKWAHLVGLYDEVIRTVTDDDLKVALLTRLAQIHELELENDEAAVQTHARVLQVDPRHLGAASAIETIHERNSDYARLVPALKQKAEIVDDPTQKKQLLYKAAQIEEEILENADEAIATYRAVLASDELDAFAMDSLERLYIRLERWAPLKDIYAKKAELAANPDEKKQMLFVLGQVHDRELGDVARAIETYQAILDIDAEDLNAIQALDRLYGQAGRWYDLLQILEREVELSGSTGETVALKHRIGELWEKELKDLVRAIDAYREALALNPAHEPTIAALDGLVHREGEPVLAAQVLEPIYEQSAEFERLIDLYEVMVTHAEDPLRRVELLHRIADLYERRLERYDSAFQAFGRALREDPTHSHTVEHLERLAEMTRAWEPLAQLYEAELQKTLDAPRQVELLLRLARVYDEELARAPKAIATHRRVLDADPENRDAILALDRLYEGGQSHAELAEILRKQIRLAESDEEIVAIEFRLAQLYEQALRDVPQAIEVYREILGQDQDHAPTVAALEMLFVEGSYQLEIAAILEPLYRMAGHWEKLHRIQEVQLEKLADPAERQAAFQRLAELAEQKLGDAERAFRWWGAAYTEDPRSEQAGEELERLASDTQAWTELVAVYQAVLANHPEKDVQRTALIRMARVHDAELRDLAQAEEAYLRVLALDAQDAEALAALDRIYEQQGMASELAEILRRRVEITDATDEVIELQFRLGRTYAEVLGDLDQAIACYDAILENDSRNRQALECLERVYFRREEWQQLYEVYEKLVDVARGDDELADVYARMARLSSDALSDDDRAADLWGRVIDLRGEDMVGLSALGELYERREMWREMVDVIERQVRVAAADADKVALYKRLGKVWSDKLARERNALEAWYHAYELDPQDLETLRALAGLYRSTQSWEELSDTLRRILDVGQVSDQVPEEELIDLYAQLGQLEGDVLGRTNEAVEAWRRVLALEPTHGAALGALETLFTREGRWEECIDVLDKRAAVTTDSRLQLDTLLQAAAIWEEKVGDKVQAAQTYERVRAVEPGNVIASAQLESIYREQYNWEKLTEVLLERVEHTERPPDRIAILQSVAKIYEEEVGDQESAFVVLQAAFKEDYAYEPVARDLERLATAAGKWEDLLADYSQVVAGLEQEEPGKAADLWVKIGRWYGDHLSHMDYAIHSIQAALRLDPKHLGALSAMADFQRKRGSWNELIETLSRHAALEQEPSKRTELYLSLAELLETQLQDTQQAISAYREALAADPQDLDALQALDRLYRKSELWEQLIDVLSKKAEITSDPDEQVRLRLEIGRHWDERLNEAGEAIEAYRQVLVTEPQNLHALRALERLYERTGQSEAYLDILEQQLDASPSDSEKISLYQRMAQAWEERFGKLDRAAESHEKILALDERNAAAYKELERLYTQEKRWDSLVDAYRRHIMATGDSRLRIDLYCSMGAVYERELEDFDRAIEAYNDVLTFDAEEARALDALGRLYERIEDWDRAIDTMSRLCDATGDAAKRVDLLHRVGRILDERMGDADGAEERFLAALGLDPAHVPTMTSLTAHYKRREDWQKAAQMMVRAEQHVHHPLEKKRLLFEAAQIYFQRLGDEARAMEFFAATIALDPEHVEAGEPLAELYFREGRWVELEPILDMLVRKAGQVKRDNRGLNELYYRTARTADELGNHDKALKYYKAAYDLDSTYLPTLLGRANLLYKMGDWDGAGKIYQTILVQHRESQKEADVVEIYFRLGQVRLKLNERKKALNMFEKALELDPAHPETLNAVIDLQTQQGDFEAVIQAKRSLMQRADEAERLKLLEEIGDLYHGKLANPQKAIAAYVEALEVKPSNHALLQKTLDLYTETKQWKKAVEVMIRFADLEPNPLRKGKYFYAAGAVSRDEVKSLDDAVSYFNQALDSYFSDPEKVLAQDVGGYLKPFEAIDKILTAKKDWKNLERSYRQMIKRMPQRPGDKLLTMLWHNLGEIYRSRLKDYKAAAQAFEVAANLEPDNRQRHEILAELFVLSGPEFADKAIREHMTMLKAEPFKIDSYKALRKIYMDSHQFDKAWCICNTLAFLKKADPEEQQFFEQYRPKGFVRAKQRLTDDIWKKVVHPDEDRYVSAILGAVWQGAALVHAQPHKAFGLKRKDKRAIETDQLLFSKVFYYVSQVLNVPLPEVYLQPEQPGEILLGNCEEKGQLLPSIVVRSNLLQGRPEKEIAFVCSKELTFLRPEHYLKRALPTNANLKTAFMSALLVVQPKFPIKPDMVPLVQQYLPHLQSKLQANPQWLEALHQVVKRFLQQAGEVDLARWGNAVEATAHRVGFILCGDLEVAAKLVSMEPTAVGGVQTKDKIKELVLYSISEEYFAVRQHLGTVIG